MQLCTFSATSSAEVLTQIRQELGPDAIILDSKEENGVVTMTAALDRPAPKSSGNNGNGAKQPAGWLEWHNEWDFIRQHLLELAGPSLRLEELPPRQRVAVEFLQRAGMNNEACLALVARLRRNPEATILEPLSELVPVKAFASKNWQQRIHIVTGPYGVGKTMTALRLALLSRHKNPECRVAIINADTARGNGRLLLRHYSELSEVPYKEAQTPMEILEATVKYLNDKYDKIIIDVPSLGKTENLEDFMAACGLPEDDTAVHITLSPQYGEQELRALVKRYAASLPTSLIWTKLDEAEHYGALINIACLTKLPISALSYGGNIGNSFADAKATTLWRLIFKNELPTDSS